MNESELMAVHDELMKVWKKLSDPGGSFADAIAEPSDVFEDVMAQMYPVEDEATEAFARWAEGKEMPALSPGACRLLEMRFYAAAHFARHLSRLGGVCIPPGWTRYDFLSWLLCDVHADTTQVALDGMRSDLLLGGIYPRGS